MTANPQKVLYFDFELTEKQFEMRYAADPRDGEELLRRHHRFSDKLYTAEIALDGDFPDDFASFEQYLRASVEKGVRRVGAKIVIIDNITYLRGPNDTAREAIPLMRELRRLKKELGLSILVLAHTPKRDIARRITVNDLQGSKVLSNFANNIFAIGQSGIDAGIRYLKHIKQRSGGMLYDASYVPAFEILKRNGNFLEFEFKAFGEEERHLYPANNRIKEDRARVVREMAEKGLTQRAIAEKLGISLTSVNRYLHMDSGNVDYEEYSYEAYEDAEMEDVPFDPADPYGYNRRYGGKSKGEDEDDDDDEPEE